MNSLPIENWMVYLFILQQELQAITKELSTHYKNPKISTYSRMIWFDILKSTRSNNTILSSKFTTFLTPFHHPHQHKASMPPSRLKQLEAQVLRDLENKNPGGNGPKINYDLIFGGSANLLNMSKKKFPNLKSEAKSSLEDQKLERKYFYLSRRFYKSKNINDRKRAVSGQRGGSRRRRRSSNLKLFQDESTIAVFKQFEENLIAGDQESKFWEILFRSGECLKNMHIEQLVKRYCQVYVYEAGLPLNKTPRVTIKAEMAKISNFINSALFLNSAAKEVTVEEYYARRSVFHFGCFILGFMKSIFFGKKELFLRRDMGLSGASFPFRLLDVEIFVERQPWETVRSSFKCYFRKFQKFFLKETGFVSGRFDDFGGGLEAIGGPGSSREPSVQGLEAKKVENQKSYFGENFDNFERIGAQKRGLKTVQSNPNLSQTLASTLDSLNLSKYSSSYFGLNSQYEEDNELDRSLPLASGDGLGSRKGQDGSKMVEIGSKGVFGKNEFLRFSQPENQPGQQKRVQGVQGVLGDALKGPEMAQNAQKMKIEESQFLAKKPKNKVIEIKDAYAGNPFSSLDLPEPQILAQQSSKTFISSATELTQKAQKTGFLDPTDPIRAQNAPNLTPKTPQTRSKTPKPPIPFISYKSIVALIHLAMGLANEPFFIREVVEVISAFKRKTFNRRIDYVFGKRKNYLMANLRFFKEITVVSLNHSFQMLYNSPAVWSESRLRAHFSRKRENSDFCVLGDFGPKRELVVKTLIIRTLNKACVDYGIGAMLSKIARKLISSIIAILGQNDPFLRKQNHLTLGVITFVIKLFYGVGQDCPSLVNLREDLVKKLIKNSDLKQSLLECLKLIHGANDDAEARNNPGLSPNAPKTVKKSKKGKVTLIGFSRRIPIFDELMRTWIAFYDAYLGRMRTMHSFKQINYVNAEKFSFFIVKILEEHVNQKSEIGNGDEIINLQAPKKPIFELKKSQKLEKSQIPKNRNSGNLGSSERIPGPLEPSNHSFTKVISVERNILDVKKAQNEEELRDELREEVEFFKANFGVSGPRRKRVEVPHPSDIYVKFRRLGSCPFEQWGVDFKILVAFTAFYFGLEKERVLQVSQKVEKLILDRFLG